jgi:hypothetical protein
MLSYKRFKCRTSYVPNLIRSWQADKLPFISNAAAHEKFDVELSQRSTTSREIFKLVLFTNHDKL